MGRYIIKRLLILIPVILGVTIVIFTIMYFCPGDPARIIAGANATEENVREIREQLGLNRPYIVRLAEYMKDVYLHFDFGTSIINGRSITAEIVDRLPRTIMIAALSVVLAVIAGVPLGITAAVHQYTWRDNLSMFLALIGASVPAFWLAMLLSLFFGLHLGWFPTSGISGWTSYVLPLIANSVSGIATMARQARSSMLEVIRSDYVVTARAKGQQERNVIYNHALRNALIPLITQAGNTFGWLLGGTMIIESVFSIPGLGLYTLNNIQSRDYMAIQGTVIILAVLFGIVMLAVDLIYAAVDPRIKSQFASGKKGG